MVERHGRHGRVGRGAARHLHDGRAQLDALGQRAQPGQRRHGVGAVGFGRPDGVDAQPVGLTYQFKREFHFSGGVAEHKSKTHGLPLIGNDEIWEHWVMALIEGDKGSLNLLGGGGDEGVH